MLESIFMGAGVLSIGLVGSMLFVYLTSRAVEKIQNEFRRSPEVNIRLINFRLYRIKNQGLQVKAKGKNSTLDDVLKVELSKK